MTLVLFMVWAKEHELQQLLTPQGGGLVNLNLSFRSG